MTTKQGINARLNAVQRERGYGKSLRAFRDALLDREFWRARGRRAPSFSYEAVRNYHLDREPSYSYVAAVVERFEINPEWIFTGEGLPLMEQVREARSAEISEEGNALWAGAVTAVPDLSGWPLAAKVTFLDVLGSYLLSFEGGIAILEADNTLRSEVVGALAREVHGMVSISYRSMREDLSHREFGQYMVALLHAVQLRIPGVGEGPHIFTRFRRLDPKHEPAIREMMREVWTEAEVEAYLEKARLEPLA